MMGRRAGQCPAGGADRMERAKNRQNIGRGQLLRRAGKARCDPAQSIIMGPAPEACGEARFTMKALPIAGKAAAGCLSERHQRDLANNYYTILAAALQSKKRRLRGKRGKLRAGWASRVSRAFPGTPRRPQHEGFGPVFHNASLYEWAKNRKKSKKQLPVAVFLRSITSNSAKYHKLYITTRSGQLKYEKKRGKMFIEA